MRDRPLILVTNDDGIYAKGLKELTEVMRLFGEVAVIAPEHPMSGMSSAFSVDKPLRIAKIESSPGIAVYKCSGTPVDCVKIGFNHLLERKPDFVVSGINHGANSSVSIIYSGTMGAAIEGCLHGVPSMGFSLCDGRPDADFTEARTWVARIFGSVRENGLPRFTCLNVNIPEGEVKGVDVCRQTTGKWVEEVEMRTDPRQRDYFWLAGSFENFEPDATGTDIHALDNGKVAVVPVQVDMTSNQALEQMKSWKI